MVIGDIRLSSRAAADRGPTQGDERPRWRYQPAAIWVMPRHFVGQLQRDFPQHTFLDAWDRDTLRRLLPRRTSLSRHSSTPTCSSSATRLRWVQSPAVGVGNLMFPALLASPVVITSARGIRARSIAEHVIGVTIALARQLPLAFRAQAAHQWAQDQLEGPRRRVRTSAGTADGHRRPRRDRDGGREDCRAVRISRLRHSPPSRPTRADGVN